jgi:phosphatidylinositol dimannoside acyltransferase
MYRAGAAVARALPTPAATPTAKAAGMALGQAMRSRRETVARHQRRVHGDHLRGAALDREVRRAIDSYARYWVELFRLPSMRPERTDAGFSYEGLGHIDDALAKGNGAIVAVPHLGNWDLGAAWLSAQGYALSAIAERVEPPELFEWFVGTRRRLGMTIEPLGPGAGTACLRALRGNEVLGLVCDRNLGDGGIDIEFFGEVTKLPAGPATLALRTGAPLLPTAIYFDGPGHHAIVRPPVAAERTGRLRDDVARVTQALAHELEGLIRVAPEQWHLFQPNWPSDPGYVG